MTGYCSHVYVVISYTIVFGMLSFEFGWKKLLWDMLQGHGQKHEVNNSFHFRCSRLFNYFTEEDDFFFLIRKARYINEEAESYKYTGRIQSNNPLSKQKKSTRPTTPQLDANHSKNPIRDTRSSPIYNLAQLHKLQTKEFLSFWISNTPPLKVNLFLSFKTFQKIHNGMDFHIFFLFFPKKEPLQLVKTSFTVSGKTHCTPDNPRTISHRTLTTIQ